MPGRARAPHLHRLPHADPGTGGGRHCRRPGAGRAHAGAGDAAPLVLSHHRTAQPLSRAAAARRGVRPAHHPRLRAVAAGGGARGLGGQPVPRSRRSRAAPAAARLCPCHRRRGAGARRARHRHRQRSLHCRLVHRRCGGRTGRLPSRRRRHRAGGAACRAAARAAAASGAGQSLPAGRAHRRHRRLARPRPHRAGGHRPHRAQYRQHHRRAPAGTGAVLLLHRHPSTACRSSRRWWRPRHSGRSRASAG